MHIKHHSRSLSPFSVTKFILFLIIKPNPDHVYQTLVKLCEIINYYKYHVPVVLAGLPIKAYTEYPLLLPSPGHLVSPCPPNSHLCCLGSQYHFLRGLQLHEHSCLYVLQEASVSVVGSGVFGTLKVNVKVL